MTILTERIVTLSRREGSVRSLGLDLLEDSGRTDHFWLCEPCSACIFLQKATVTPFPAEPRERCAYAPRLAKESLRCRLSLCVQA